MNNNNNNNMSLNNDDVWNIIRCMLTKNNGKELVKHHIESYDIFLERYIPNIIDEFNDIEIKKTLNDEIYHYKISIKNPIYTKPTYKNKYNHKKILSVKNSRDSNFTYNLSLYVDIIVNVTIYDKEQKIINNRVNNYKHINIADIPLIVGSKYCTSNDIISKDKKSCNFDKGGYFLVNGSDKVLITQERMCDNIPFFFTFDDGKYSHSCEIRSNRDMTQMAHAFKLKYVKNNNTKYQKTFVVSFNNIKDDIPLVVLFKFLGAKNDIVNYILGNDYQQDYLDFLEPSIYVSQKALENDNVESIIKRNMNNKTIPTEYLKNREILPHLKSDKEKMIYIGFMTKKLMNHIMFGLEETDRDSFENKRVENTGVLMAQLFRKLYSNMLKSLKNPIIKDKVQDDNITKYIKKAIITNGIKFSIATGNWNAKIGADNKKIGIAQVLNRLNFNSTLSNFRRLNAPIGKKGKMIEPRKLHNSQYGWLCAVESPEGQSVGLVKNLALSTNITVGTFEEPINNIIDNSDNVMKIEDIKHSEINKSDTMIFVNGRCYAYTTKPLELTEKIRKLRRNGKINYEISIGYNIDENTIDIFTTEGRLIRPLFLLKDGKLKITKKILRNIKDNKINWYDLLTNGIIEYIDVNEVKNTYIAKTIDDIGKDNYTHCELHSSMMLGICASLIPFLEHNQAPRNTYQAAQGKQAIGINTTDFKHRMDTISYLLHYPQKPIVYTRSSDLLGMNEMPAGDNVIIAIATYTGLML
jgi:DNA-directed RNA polymerase II subunit RPB2